MTECSHRKSALQNSEAMKSISLPCAEPKTPMMSARSNRRPSLASATHSSRLPWTGSVRATDHHRIWAQVAGRRGVGMASHPAALGSGARASRFAGRASLLAEQRKQQLESVALWRVAGRVALEKLICQASATSLWMYHVGPNRNHITLRECKFVPNQMQRAIDLTILVSQTLLDRTTVQEQPTEGPREWQIHFMKSPVGVQRVGSNGWVAVGNRRGIGQHHILLEMIGGRQGAEPCARR